jgi:hypothetical protein
MYTRLFTVRRYNQLCIFLSSVQLYQWRIIRPIIITILANKNSRGLTAAAVGFDKNQSVTASNFDSMSVIKTPHVINMVVSMYPLRGPIVTFSLNEYNTSSTSY